MKQAIAMLLAAGALIAGTAHAEGIVFKHASDVGQIELTDMACPESTNPDGYKDYRIARGVVFGKGNVYGCWYSLTGSDAVTIDWIASGGADTRSYPMSDFFSTPYFDQMKADATARREHGTAQQPVAHML